MQGARPDAVRALLGEGNAAARWAGPQTLTVFYARVLKALQDHPGECHKREECLLAEDVKPLVIL
jgi:hypothetical protein